MSSPVSTLALVLTSYPVLVAIRRRLGVGVVVRIYSSCGGGGTEVRRSHRESTKPVIRRR